MTTLDKILIGCAIFITIFTVTMIVIFCVFQAIPDVLIESVFSLFTGECIVCFIIWYAKRRFNLKDEEGEQEE